MIPIWGPVKQSAHDFDCGKNFWGAVNLGLGVLDAATAASAIEGVARGAWKTGGVSWRTVNSVVRGERATYQPGVAGASLVRSNRTARLGSSVPDWFKNQPWNLNP